jgi:3-oxoacyl-(acyl-carrier-protein) synthase
MNALSARNEEPGKASRPFDKNRDGFVMGEGAGVLVLEEYLHAMKRGAKIYAELVGYGQSTDAFHVAAPRPDGYGAQKAMQIALANAKVLPTDIQYINAHGTSTPDGDAAETKAILNTFGEHAYKIKINSTKSMTGHLLGGAGGVEAIATILSLHSQRIHPTINLDIPDPLCPLDYTPNKAIDLTIEHGLSNSFGFGGHNACLIFKRLR